MGDLILILVGIIVLFFLFVILKGIFRGKLKEEFCAICLAVSLTWIILLILYWLGLFDNLLIIGLLIGLSVLGIFYLWERKVRKEFTFFRLPFLLSLILIGYYLLTFNNIISEIILLLVLWIVFGMVFAYRNNKSLKKFVDKIVECCKRW